MIPRHYPPPGRHIELPSGVNIHFNAQGSSTSPTVVFEAGISGSSLSWSTVQPLVAEFAHAITYDRAGLGWTTGALPPRTTANMVSELAATLDRANISEPYILVGHSFGCLLMQAFAHTHPTRTTALVMVDPVTQLGWAHPEPSQLRRLKLGARLARRGALLARFGIVRAALSLLTSGSTKFPQLIARASAGQGNSVIERLIAEVRKLPPSAQPIVASHWSRSRSFQALAAYLECLPANARDALNMPTPPEIPLVILSAATAASAELSERDAWIAGNSNAHHIQVPNTGHWLQLERPDLVASIIRNLLKPQ